MDIQATKIELVKQLLNVSQESVLNKIKAILASESEETIVYTTSGKPLDVEQYKAKIQRGLDDIKASRVTSDEDLTKEIEMW